MTRQEKMQNKIGLQVRKCTEKGIQGIDKGSHVKGSVELDNTG